MRSLPCADIIKKLTPLSVCLLAALVFVPVLAAAPTNPQMNWAGMGMGLFGGLALFLSGMEQMAEALKAAAGERMKTILASLTNNRVTAAVTGAFVTAVIQSSSVTTVLVVGFVSAGLLSLTQSIGIIMGANIGTTVTAQIVAFKVTEAALVMIALGFGLLFFSKQDKTKHFGDILMGLGLVFFGMTIMSDTMQPLRSHQPFLDFMTAMDHPLLGLLVAAVFTALIQSSSATTGIVVVMASQGFITLPAGIAMALGANIGTCVTALLASIGKTQEATRAALVHILFNVFGALLWLTFIPNLAELATAVSPVYTALSGTERLAAETPRQIANANTLFNVVNTLLFLPFAGLFARLAHSLVSDKVVEEAVIVESKYLDDELVETPALALERVRLEFGHMGEVVEDMLARIQDALLNRDREQLEQIAKLDDQADILHENILRYLMRIRKQALTDQESVEFSDLMVATDNLEHIGDVIETGLVSLGHKAVDEDIRASETMRRTLGEVHTMVSLAVKNAVQAISRNDEHAAQDVVTMKQEINHQIDIVLEHQAAKLGANDPKRLQIFRIEMEIVDYLRRIYTLAKRIAKVALPEAVAGSESG